MKANLLLLTFFSLMLAGCIGGEDTTNKIQAAAQAKAQQQSYDIQLTGDWIKDAKVVDSNNQQASYKGKGVYSFKNKPQGNITLTGGTFENTGLANKMVMRAAANSKTLSPLNSFLYENPHLKNQVLNALNNEGSNNQNAQFKTSKVIYLMASNNLLNKFSSSLNNVQNYNDIVAVARDASAGSTNAESINTALMLMGLSFFNISEKSHISKIDLSAPTVTSVSPTNNNAIGTKANRRPTFTITFSETVKNATATNITLTKTGNISIPLTITAVANTPNNEYKVKATPKADLESSASYTLTLKSGIKDNAGNALAEVTRRYTAGDFIAPTVKVSPDDGKIGKSTNKPTFTITFSEAVKNIVTTTTESNITLVKKGTTTKVRIGISTVWGNDFRHTVTPIDNLEPDATYTLTIKKAITDKAGNPLAQDKVKEYTTYAQKRYVTENGGASIKDGKSWATAYEGAKLQQAIDDVEVKKGEVWIAKGVYKPGTSTTDSFELEDGVKLYGGFAGTENTLAARNSDLTLNKTVFSGDIDNNDARRTADGITNSYRDIVGRNSENIITLKDATDDNTLIDRVYITGGSSNSEDKAGGLTLKDAKITLKDIRFFGNKNTAESSTAKTTGGAINVHSTDYRTHSTLIIDGAIFKRNYALYGGAIADRSALLDINNAQFDNNWAKFNGGAISSRAIQSASIKNSRFKGNHAKHGGAFYNNSNISTAPIKITNVAFINNFAKDGGAIYNSRTSSALNKVTFYGNRVQFDGNDNSTPPGIIPSGKGGAIFNESIISSVRSTITNTTFAYNTNFSVNSDAQPKGGAIYNHSSAPRIINSTFVYNRTKEDGGAMYTRGNHGSATTGKPMLVNSILWHNNNPNSNSKRQYSYSADTYNSNEAIKSHSHIDTDVGTRPATPIFKKVKQTTAGVEHIYYQLKTALTGALPSGSQAVGSTTVTIPNKDQVDTPRGSSVNKGAIQAADANISGATSQPFIQYISGSQSSASGSPTKTINIKFNERMNIATINTTTIVVKDEDGTTPSLAFTHDQAANKFISDVSFTVTPGKWYSLTIKEGIKKYNMTDNCTAIPSAGVCLNREYTYEFKAD